MRARLTGAWFIVEFKGRKIAVVSKMVPLRIHRESKTENLVTCIPLELGVSHWCSARRRGLAMRYEGLALVI